MRHGSPVAAEGRLSMMVTAGVILAVVAAISVAIVLVLFVWAAREDGRDQERTDARLRRR